MSYRETIVKFGRSGGLCGIECLPESRRKTSAILIINAGAVHKVGPFSLGTELARKMSDLGYPSLRFDLSGQGESLARAVEASRDQIVLQDMTDALDHIEDRMGCTEVVAIGLCTGADNAHKIGVADARVNRIVCLDGYAYETPRFRRNRLLRKLRSPWSILAGILRRVVAKLRAQARSAGALEEEQFIWELPAENHYKEQLLTLKAKEKKSLYVFSGGVAYYNYQGQLADFCGAPLSDIIHERYLPHADHAYMLRKDREQLMSILQEWFDQYVA